MWYVRIVPKHALKNHVDRVCKVCLCLRTEKDHVHAPSSVQLVRERITASQPGNPRLTKKKMSFTSGTFLFLYFLLCHFLCWTYMDVNDVALYCKLRNSQNVTANFTFGRWALFFRFLFCRRLKDKVLFKCLKCWLPTERSVSSAPMSMVPCVCVCACVFSDFFFAAAHHLDGQWMWLDQKWNKIFILFYLVFLVGDENKLFSNANANKLLCTL